MFLILPLVLLLGPAVLPQKAASPEKKDANALAEGVDRTFAKMRDFSADFVHTFEDSLNRKRQEAGHLYLAKERKMRWEYNRPEEKLFISNGKTVYFFDPGLQRVQKDEVKNISDDQVPMMFLVGRSGLKGEFKEIELFGTQVLRLTPKRKGDIRKIEVEVDPVSYLITRLVVYYEDARSEFSFTNIRTNIGLPPDYFDFKAPPGVEVVQGLGQ
jgi:outer membrane lipoprotein carrier protein